MTGPRPHSAGTAGGGEALFFRKLLVLLATLLVLAFLYAVRRLLLLLGFAVLFAYVCEPLISLVEDLLLRWRVRQARLLALAAIYLGAAGGLAAVGVALLPRLGRQLERLSLAMPGLVAAIQGRFDRGLAVLRNQQSPGAFQNAIDRVVVHVTAAATTFAEGLALHLTAVLAYLPWLILVPVLAFFLLKDAATFQSLALQIMPQGRLRWRAADFFGEVNRVLATYVRAQILVALTVAVGSGLLLALCGIQFWLLLAGGAAILEFIPMLGPALFAVVAGLLASDQGRALPVLAGLIVLRALVDYLVSPTLIRRGLELHPLAILLALLCGSQLAGIAGLFLAIPLMAVGLVTYRYALLQTGSTGLVASLLRAEDPVDIPALTRVPMAEPQESSHAALRGTRVLVVDNEPEARETVALVLQSAGARVLEADSSGRAIELLRSEAPDVLVSDIGMPREDGLDLIRKVRALPRAAGGVPAIALTGYATDEDRNRILAAGFQLYLRKPVASEDLIAAVRLVLPIGSASPLPLSSGLR